MEKHVGLNPAWFEPGLNGKSPFSELYRKSLYNTQSLDDSISAAFRALIAQDAAQEPEQPGLQVGDVDKDAEIAELRESLEARLAIGRDHTREYSNDLDCNGTVNCARSNDRRRTAGTIADRGKAS